MLAPPSADNGQRRCRDAPPSLVRQDGMDFWWSWGRRTRTNNTHRAADV